MHILPASHHENPGEDQLKASFSYDFPRCSFIFLDLQGFKGLLRLRSRSPGAQEVAAARERLPEERLGLIQPPAGLEERGQVVGALQPRLST